MNNIELLQQCCRLIEEQLGWGSSDNWQNQDFEALSSRIFERTQVALSVSTLKRVWGKVKYDNFPSLTTLNTLAIFAGFEHWRDYRQQQLAVSGQAPVPEPDGHMASLNGHGGRTVKRRHIGWYIAPGVLVILVIAGWMYNRTGKNGVPVSGLPDGARFSFSSQPLAAGIPNSVIFNYDAAAAKNDSVFIQQSWDPKRRFRVPATGHTYTSIYYYPGFFKAKLVIGKRIVKEHDLCIPSNGWLAAVDQEPVPVYFSREEFIGDGALRIPLALMEKMKIPMHPQPPELRYYNIGDLHGLKNDNFIFETEVKNDYKEGTAICQPADIYIHCEGSAIILPLGIPGCVGEMRLMAVDTGFSAQGADLSGFGCNMSEWVKVRCEARNKHLQVWVNGKEAFNYTFKRAPDRIVGVSYRFRGAGAVNAVKFSGPDGTAVLEDTFDD
ncbi:hypothetical protein [uncultured Chitinophaga sp.]|jgi:hypothetical protein|uniref:hypothetical protein n=1 Tax=uncultured Chitinophaga sp. TaxID=339340 RepID=UPI0026332C65|nr:hypothetical protein [uncultured Chitinophaga sp.]